MRKKIIKTLLLTTTLMSLFTIGAKAEWRQIDEGKWNYYDENNTLVRDSFVDNGQYYVDSNGLWLSKEARSNEKYKTLCYVKETGKIESISTNPIPISRVNLQTGERITFDIVFIKESDFGTYDGMRNYKVVNDSGIWKIERINNINTSK